MKFTDQDYRETDFVAEIIKKTESSSIEELSAVLDEMRKYQPILISVFLGFKDDLSYVELDELAKDLIIIWKFFSDKPKSKQTKISENLLYKFDKKNAEFINYLSGEDSEQEFQNATKMDLESIESKGLYSGIFFRYNENKVHLNMNQEIRNELILQMKSLIECFEYINH